jgi:FG-GAP-like repeat
MTMNFMPLVTGRYVLCGIALAVLAWIIPQFALIIGDPQQGEAGEANPVVRSDRQQVRVRVDRAPVAGRPFDERPAEYRLIASDFAAYRRIDPATLRVVRYDPHDGRELSEPLPFRWYDDSVPYDFPECEQNIHATDGLALRYIARPRRGELYNLRSEGAGGRLVWLHRQEAQQPAHYAITFRLLAAEKLPTEPPPRGFVGDGCHRCRADGGSTTAMIHSRVTVADWNNDGLTDLLIGGARGHVLLYANEGTRLVPQFGYGRLIALADGTPLDVGWSAAPLAVDWDGDGLTDLLCGAERNRLLFFRNTGTAAAPRLVNRGFVGVDGRPLQLPIEPVPKSPPGVYTLDYYPVIDVVDWNGDGRADLLAGGYITGRIFLFENEGKGPDGAPQLTSRGPLEADGRILNVGDWAASPCAADFDGDGDFDLVSGNMAMTAGGGDATDVDHFLRYYENTGTRKGPVLAERDFPKVGRFPNGVLATPRPADLNGDGLLDLVVSSSESVYLYFNVGTARKPQFEVHDLALPTRWGSVPLPTWGLQFLDWDGDGRKDLLCGLSIFRNQGNGEFRADSLLPADNVISHPPPRGDGWTFTQLADLDGDGHRDLLYGTHEGEIWLHRHTGGHPARFDEAGLKLLLDDGQPLRVGPVPGQAIDFDVLQGARTTLTVADFDADGRLDLVVGDTYGDAMYYRNVGTKSAPRFAPPTLLGNLKIRMVPFATDWNRDGKTDIVGSAASGTVVLWRNLGENRFSAAEPIAVPELPYSPSVAIIDWNDDGDDDVIVGTSYGFFCWFERSFLEQGYAAAQRVE